MSHRLSSIAALLLAGRAVAAEPLVIDYHGNTVLPDGVYSAALGIPDDAPATAETVELVAAQLMAFLHDAGFELATVRAEVVDGKLRVLIDEGRLDRIIFPEQGAFELMRLRLALTPPGRVFNRGWLEGSIARVKRQRDYSRLEYKLVPVAEVHHTGIQIEDLEALETLSGIELIPDIRPYELHIVAEGQEWRGGWGADLALRSPDGLVLGVKYRGGSLIFADDRWETRFSLGLRLDDLLQGSDGRRFVSRGGVETKWYTPDWLDIGLRPLLHLRANYLTRQRLDLLIENYDYVRIDPALSLTLSFGRYAIFSAGGGLEFRKLLVVEDLPGTPVPRVDPSANLRPFLSARIELVFDPTNPRHNQRHRFEADARMSVSDSQDFSRVEYEYQKVWTRGFDEVWLMSEGAAVFGAVAFPDEVLVARFIRGLGSDTLFTEHGAGLETQYRLSLARDLYKVSALAGGAVYRPPPNGAKVGGGATFGIGFHVLAWEAMQMDFFLAGGYATTGELLEVTFTAALAEAY